MTELPYFPSIGRYAKSLADDLLFTRMAEAVFNSSIELGYAVSTKTSSVPPAFTEEEFALVMGSALRARVKEMFESRGEEEIQLEVEAQMTRGFGKTLIYAVFFSFAEHNIFFVK